MPAGGQHLGLAQLGAGDADGAGRKLHPGQRGALVRLGVRPQAHRAVPEIVGHTLDVGLDRLDIQAQRRSVELGLWVYR